MADRPSSVHLPLNVLNPGTSTRRERRSCCRCLIWTVIIVATFCTAWISLFVGWSFRQWISNIRSPHKEHYFNATQDPLPNLIVRPLIDENQTFDIAVSVWLRTTEEEEAAYRRNRAADVAIGDKGDIVTKIDVPTIVGDANGKIEDPQEEREDILETPLFSDIVFRGLRLKDKGISQKVQFRLPTSRFIGSSMSNMDLRGSFVLIPTSPSLLNYLKNYSNWFPETLNVYPHRSWPFPLGSTSQSERTLVDKAVELFGFSVPLLEFHEVQSRCLNLNSSLDNITHTTTLADDATFHTVKEGDYGTGSGLDNEDADDESSANASMSRLSKIPVHKRHPYVVTRTQLRIVDQTTLFNRNAYNKAYNKLKVHACGSGIPNVKQSWKLCTRDYKQNGHWETRLELKMPAPGNDGNVRTEWAYGPYLDSYKNAVGPQDLVAVSVTRENCTIAANRTTPVVVFPKQDEEFMNITWHLSFSGRSPAKMAIADSFGLNFSPVGHNQSEYESVMAQDKAELINGIAGHRFYDDSHPRRRVALTIMGSILGFINFFINGHYWYTLTSTFSISISGTMLLVLADFADVGIQALMTVQESMTTGFWMNTFVSFPAVLMVVITLLPQFAMIKAVMRLECAVDSGWFLRLRRVPANHKERASERLDGRTSKTFRLALFTCLVVIYYFLRPHKHFAIPARTPPPAVEDFPTHKLRDLSPSVLIPLRLAALIQQMLLNHRTRTFAGQHKLSVVISCIAWSMNSTIFIPAIVGRVRTRQGLSNHDIIDTVALIVSVWQALTLTSVTQTQGHEEED